MRGNGMGIDTRTRISAAMRRNVGGDRRRLNGLIGPLLFMSVVELSGCHTQWLVDASDPIVDNTRFMNTWETYRHCRSSSEPDEIRTDLQELNTVVQIVTQQNQPSVHFPAAIRSWMDALPSRLAVDPNAMAAACAMHGARVAQSAGRPGLSAELFTAAGSAQEGSSFVRYVDGANRILKRR